MTERTPPTDDEMIEALLTPFQKLLDHIGCGMTMRAKKWKALANAKMVKASYDKDLGHFKYSKKLEDNPIQLKAAENLSKFGGDFPAEKHEITAIITPKLSDEDRQALTDSGFGEKLINAILNKHRSDIIS